ncbi:collagenase [Pseudoalteromonas luteoviolacea]|uniref:collagenase n=1 Tax=Pseudoalteromonas luteoviolacea TaxID=43657 RepID=UPI001B3A3EC0|nr:collagenase [Pseudoalteromonas luteoviolacea]MBQ4877810.1 collagenase [Pseudoalteromonas luteoviolacea]MBQ4906744.1 collagenase [Pseudoalteromonas luteoviolacea]
MKIQSLAIALPLVACSLQSFAHQVNERAFKPLQTSQLQHLNHGDEHGQAVHDNAPTAQNTLLNHTESVLNSALMTMKTQAAVVQCDINLLAQANDASIADLVVQQGASCVNELFSASSNLQISVFTTEKMRAAAIRAKSLATSYDGNGSAALEALFLFIRAGYYVEFYNDSVSFGSSLKPDVRAAIDEFVKSPHFYTNSDAHGKVLKEVITSMDSSEMQDVYLPVVKAWLLKWQQSYADKWYMRSAVNGIFTILYRGQWNTEFVAKVQSDSELVNMLAEFTKQNWMIGSDAEYLIINSASELARLKTYKNAPIQPAVDTALKDLFSRFESFGYGDGIWLAAADVATYYADCDTFGICNFEQTLTQKALSQTHQCSPTIRIRSQNMTAQQHLSACQTMALEETRFHQMLATNQTPVADDNNAMLQVNIFDSSSDYGKYAKAIFKIDTNNGGMYLEGDPSKVGNQANFIAYEASYAKADHFVWNLEHEYVHYLDGRFDLYGDFNAPTEAIVWWSEGVAEYVANLNDNQAAIDTIKDGSTYRLNEIFATTYAGFDQDRIYRWGYLAVRFMFERHFEELKVMLTHTREGNWSGYKTTVDDWAQRYDQEFTQWTLALAGSDDNKAPLASINGPYSGTIGNDIQFSSQGSTDPEGQVLTYLWQFGDGAQSTSANPTHIYSAQGTYTVSLTVSDPQGAQASVSTSVEVSETANNVVTLLKGQSVTVTAEQDAFKYFKLTLPPGATDLVIATSGGTGDADLYVKQGQVPTLDSYDCRPYVGGNAERCDIAQPLTGDYFIMLRGYNRFENVTLVADFTPPASTLPDLCVTQGGLSGGRLSAGTPVCLAASQTPMWFSLENVQEQGSISIQTAHGSGDLTLEYSNQGWPNDTNVEARSALEGNSECINLTGQSQYWGYLKVSGMHQGATVLVRYNEGYCN